MKMKNREYFLREDLDTFKRKFKAVCREKEFGINFFDRTRVAFLLNDDIYIESIQNLKEKIEKEIISEDSLTFNNLVGTIGEMKTNWLSPAKDTWLERYF